MKLSVVLLAAGASQRFNGIKQLADIDGQSMIKRALSLYQGSHPTLIYLVVGANNEVISQHLSVTGPLVRLVYASDWAQGMGHSIVAAMQQVSADTSHLLLATVDQVALTSTDLDRLINACKAHPDMIIASAYEGTLGVPAIFPQRFFAGLKELSGDKGARGLIKANVANAVAVDSVNAATDIDTRAQWQAWCRHRQHNVS